MSHLKLHFVLHTPHFTFHTALLALHTPHFTLHTALFALHTSHFTLHTPHFTLHSPHFTLLNSHCFLHTALFTLHTTLFTPHTWHCTLHIPHFISSELFSPHLLLVSSLLICHLSKFFSTVFISSEYWSTFLMSLKFVSLHLSCSARQKALTVREKSLAPKNHWAQKKVFAHRHLRHRFIYIRKPFRHTLYYKACTKHFPVLLCTTKLAQSISQYYFALQSLHKLLPSTTVYYKACKKYFPVLLCTTKLAQSISQLYFVLQSLRKLLPSTTLYYNACTKSFPVLLCTTRRPSTTLYYKACTKYIPVLHCTAKLAQSTCQYYFALQSLHKARSNTTLYHKACAKYFPVLLCTTKLAQSTSQDYFVLLSLQKHVPVSWVQALSWSSTSTNLPTVYEETAILCTGFVWLLQRRGFHQGRSLLLLSGTKCHFGASLHFCHVQLFCSFEFHLNGEQAANSEDFAPVLSLCRGADSIARLAISHVVSKHVCQSAHGFHHKTNALGIAARKHHLVSNANDSLKGFRGWLRLGHDQHANLIWSGPSWGVAQATRGLHKIVDGCHR